MADNRLKAVATAQAYDQGNIANLDDAITRRLVASTVLTESYGGDLDPINRLGYVGRYQAGAAWLVDAGYMDMDRYRAARDSMSASEWERGGGQLRFMQDARNWNDGLSLDRYLASDDLQDRAFRINSNRSYQQALRNGLLDENSSPETVAGFLKARHLSGYDGARNAVQGGRVIRDENGTSNYDYFHDITRNRDGLNEYMGRIQAQPGQTVPQPTPGQTQTAPDEQPRGPRSFDNVMRVMLPPQNGVNPHITSDFGPRSIANGSSNHRGVDFNYVGGQQGVNLRHPTVHSPVSGVVVYGDGQGSYGTVKIRDDQGNLHEILHLDSRSVRVTDPPTRVNAGDPIGTMGGRGPDGARDYAQHVHYQVRNAAGQLVDPEAFWNSRTVQQGSGQQTGTPDARNPGTGQATLRLDSHGADVVALQESLNRLGYTGRDGQPLETRSGIYGPETKFAVEALQRARGIEVDGVVGRDTRGALAIASERPLLSESTHPNHALYSAIARQLPAGTRPEVAANITLQAMENGITSVDKLQRVEVAGSDVFVTSTTPGYRVNVDLQAPTPSMQDMSDHVRQQSQQRQTPPQDQQIQAEQQERAARTVMA